MKRREFMKAAGLGVAASTLAKPAIAQSAPTITWRLQSSYPTSLDTIYGACQVFSKAVAEATDNKFKIQVFAAGEIIPPLSIVDGVQNGTVEMGQTGSYFYIGKDPAFAFGTGIPFGPNTRQQHAWFYHGGGNDLLNAFYANYKLYHFPFGGTGTQMGGWFRKEIKSKADLVGLKMRLGGLSGTVLQRLGLVPTQLAAGDIYTSLERGTLDAAEFVGPHDDEKLGLAKIAPYYYYPGFWEGAASLSLFVNLDKWNELPAGYKSLLNTAAAYAATDMLAKYDAQNPAALRRLVANGAQLRAFPQDILQESYKAAAALYAEMGEKNPFFKKILDHQMAFRNEVYPWTQISDFSYDNLMLHAMRQSG
ncbi:TRAP transporter substrate-binding protein [Microvirga roseola]|uniref:TRAP transporter substrate-binding protein n=1 Tax=Microvirga roseola TaxID=2883126 RepID=UPI001E46A433|nr:TRAP transporter substrate-binding protein [Microvirga roseola]